MTRRQALLAAPLGLAVAGGGAFYAMLRGMARGTFDPRGVPSPIVGQPMPRFSLPAQAPGEGFASWCAPCAEEHPMLLALARAGLPIWAIAYKDPADKAAAFIQRHGNPFQRIARDEKGLAAIDWGLSGVPESFVIDGKGIVRWHWAGPLDPATVQNQLEPTWKAIT